MQNFKYVVYQENEHHVSPCLNVDVASFGDSIDEAISNLREAVELYIEDDNGKMEFHQVGNTLIGESIANA